MSIYTKTGDKGTTELIGGKRVSKNHLRIESYGCVDELIAFVGLLRDGLRAPDLKQDQVQVQDSLMIVASILATDCEDCEQNLPKLSNEEIVWLENKIDSMELKLPKLSSFILPGGHTSVSQAHIARTVCRRAERTVLSLSETFEVPEVVVKYLNRLSDYFFVLSRYISKEIKAEEIPWQPRLFK